MNQVYLSDIQIKVTSRWGNWVTGVEENKPFNLFNGSNQSLLAFGDGLGSISLKAYLIVSNPTIIKKLA